MDLFTQNIDRDCVPETVCCIYFKGNDIALVRTPDSSIQLPVFSNNGLSVPELNDHTFICCSGNVHYFAKETTDDTVSIQDAYYKPLRSLYGSIDKRLFYIIMLARHILTWDLNSRFCGRCGTKTIDSTGERSKECPSCKHTVYPSPHPAIITAVIRDNTILLARHRRFPHMYTVLAGYVNPGESLEECIKREVMEEVNVEVTNIRYFMSQPWGISQSLMVGFLADYTAGTIRVDDNEILEADWFTVDQLPSYPGSPSLANYLIRYFIENRS